jgi:hypothetical protein
VRVVDLGGAVVTLDLVVGAAALPAIHLECVDALSFGSFEAAVVVGDARDFGDDLDLCGYDPDVGQVRLLFGGLLLRRGRGLLLRLRFGRCRWSCGGPGEWSRARATRRGSLVGECGWSRPKEELSRSSPCLRFRAGLT